mgnify:FL=1
MSRIEELVIDKIRQRAEVGKIKYGVTLERNDLSFKDWLIHLQEELLDGAGYIQKLIEEIDEQKQTVERNQNNTEQS